jgi:hypothetical protein
VFNIAENEKAVKEIMNMFKIDEELKGKAIANKKARQFSGGLLSS